MAWNHTEAHKLCHLLRLFIGPTMRLSQLFSLAPYPLSLVQSNCSLASVRVKVVLFVRKIFAIAVSVLTIASLLVLYFYYPELLYKPTVPMFIKILYYIGSILQVLTVANLLIGCEHRRAQYETYFERVLVVVRHTASQRDCNQTVWYRHTIKAMLLVYCTVMLILPFSYASVMFEIYTIPYTIAQVVPFTVTALILLQYYCVFVHLSSIVRKLNERLTKLVDSAALRRRETDGKSDCVQHGPDYTLYPLKLGKSYFQLIEELRSLHAQTMDIASVLTENFLPVIVLILVSTFASVNNELLELYTNIKYNTLSPLVLVLKGLYAAIKFCFYVLIAYPNWLIEKENKRSLFLLYKINMASCTDETNGSIAHYVSQISNMHGIHQACGMINLDMKLISNAVAAITSIMVVLIQFSDSDTHKGA